MIIAMDAEESLHQLGYADVAVCSNVECALDEIEKREPSFAFLDFNLGDQSSEPVAERLGELGIPFWFVTGYGDAMEKLSDSKALGVLQKPYTGEDLKKLIAAL